jgi:hypothetical protein
MPDELDERCDILEAESREARAVRDEAIGILVRLVQQANSQRFQGRCEVDEDGFIVAYRVPCGPVHSAIPFLARFGIVVDEYGGVHRGEGSMTNRTYCGRGICAAEAGHVGSCEAASGWAEIYECPECDSCLASDRPIRLHHHSDLLHEVEYMPVPEMAGSRREDER